MSDKSGESAVTDSIAASGVNEEKLQQMIQKTVMGIFKEAVPRMIQKSLTEGDFLGKAVESSLEKMVEIDDGNGAATTDASDSANVGKDTMKALRAELDQLKHGIQERDRKLQEADQRNRDIRLRSEVHSHFARHLGADSPHLAPYVNHFMAQFSDHEGQAVRKSKNDYGEDVFTPASQAIDEMFKSDLKHLVANKTQNLPVNGGFRQAGNPLLQPQTGHSQSVQQRAKQSPLMDIARSLAEDRPEAAQIIANDAMSLAANPATGIKR